jgi:5'-nucleotidase
VEVNSKPWEVYAVGGTPAQVVLHAVLEILPKKPDLVVSGINYGENVGSGITISGTVGAAMEAASMGIPSLAVSLETEPQHHYSLSEEVDFSAAAHFAIYFSRLVLANRFPHDVDLLKVDVPCDATLDTPWRITRLSHQRYFEPMAPQRASWDVPARVGYRTIDGNLEEPKGTDVYALRVQRMVSVTPLSLDMTSRIDLQVFEQTLRESMENEV